MIDLAAPVTAAQGAVPGAGGTAEVATPAGAATIVVAARVPTIATPGTARTGGAMIKVVVVLVEAVTISGEGIARSVEAVPAVVATNGSSKIGHH